MKKWLLSLYMILALVACKEEKKQETQTDAKPVIKVGMIAPLSGDAAVFGEAIKAASGMFFEEFDKKPSKFKYQLIFEDDQHKLSKQAVLAQKLINIDKVDVLVTHSTDIGTVVSPLAEQSKTIHFSVAMDLNVAKGKYNILASSNPKGEVDLLYKTLLENGAEKVDIVLAQVTGTETWLNYLKQKNEFEKKLNIDKIYYVNPDEMDFRTMLYKIKNNKPDYIITMLAMPSIDAFMRQYHENQINIPVTGIESFSYLQDKGLAEGMWYIDAATATNDFVTRYQAKTGSTTTNYAEYTDFILQMITFGYEGAGTTDKETVIDYIQNNSAGQITAVGKITTEPDGILNGQPIVRKIISGQLTEIKE